MSCSPSTPKPDRKTVQEFIAFYSKAFEIEPGSVRFPEEEPATPEDCNIDAVSFLNDCAMHIEHTSVDLIVSGRKNKRALNAGFTLIEKELQRVVCPKGKGVDVGLRFEYAKNIPLLRQVAPTLKHLVQGYVDRTPDKEWQNYPRKPDVLRVGALVFSIKPDVLHDDKAKLHWLGSEQNVLEATGLEQQLCELIPSKLKKLDRSIECSASRCFAALVVETDDIAAEDFHSHCGTFARLMAAQNTRCSEIWGIHGGAEPLLIWFDELDKGRVDDVYRDDSRHRTFAEIETERRSRWRLYRKHWFNQPEKLAAQ